MSARLGAWSLSARSGGARGGCWPRRRGARPSRTARAWRRTQSSAAGSPSWRKHQAAFHRYSITCTKSITIVTGVPRALASAWMRSIWWLLPSTSATQSARGRCRGARLRRRRRAIMSAASWATLAVNHLLVDRPAVAASRSVSLADHVGGGARDRRHVIDGADLGHPLAVALLALGEPGLRAWSCRRRRPWRSPV